ncbi:hypothetical protein QE428_002405 [Microbacterium sp. SORGH_AS 505]|uniref:hypothetical protein n=1 Tax=Microbacterium sp. SORGH_AS_0505 TaxID=3041770 RepID=UPI002788F691|nr:hypothetical protein [Microbacterium sp. SORGH_AS_0505]MDQ1127372.1 hypothetical protein [Microbacterium sp. SORGH_AS_0505]
MRLLPDDVPGVAPVIVDESRHDGGGQRRQGHARARDDHCTGQDHARQDHSHASRDALPTEAEGDDGSVDGARQDEDSHDLG